jgi:hypothetical protein
MKIYKTGGYKEKFKFWREKAKKEEHQEMIDDKRSGILKLLRTELTTEESLLLFSDIEVIFIEKMKIKLQEVSKEKEQLEKFLKL